MGRKRLLLRASLAIRAAIVVLSDPAQILARSLLVTLAASRAVRTPLTRRIALPLGNPGSRRFVASRHSG